MREAVSIAEGASERRGCAGWQPGLPSTDTLPGQNGNPPYAFANQEVVVHWRTVPFTPERVRAAFA
jgi:hypothetical protein